MKVNLNFIDTFRAKLETYRLEQRYARRDKRTTYYSSAQYRDGEYFYQDNHIPSSPSASPSPSQSSPPQPQPHYQPPRSPVTTPSSFFSSKRASMIRSSSGYQPSPEFVQTASVAPVSQVTTPGAEARIRARMSMPTVKAEEVFAYYRAENVERRRSSVVN